MKGQVAIIVLLVSAVMLSMGLSMSKSENTEVKINTNDELLKKAFDMAESGINYYLGTGATSYIPGDSESYAKIIATKISDGSNTIDFGEYTPANGSENYWLVNHLDNGNIGSTYFSGANVDVCSVGFTGSVQVDYFYKNGANIGLTRRGYNFSSDINFTVNGFVDSAGDCVRVNLGFNPLLITVTPIFNGGKFYLLAATGGVFASQGIDVSSNGIANGVNKNLSIRQRYLMPNFLTSGMVAERSILND